MSLFQVYLVCRYTGTPPFVNCSHDEGFGSAHSCVPNLLASDHAPANSLPLRWADEVPLDSASGELPEPGPQARQDYGFGAHDGEGDLSREINTVKQILRQSYGLGPARICLNHTPTP